MVMLHAQTTQHQSCSNTPQCKHPQEMPLTMLTMSQHARSFTAPDLAAMPRLLAAGRDLGALAATCCCRSRDAQGSSLQHLLRATCGHGLQHGSGRPARATG